MSLTVEDGTGLADADAYVSVSYVDAYAAKHGNPQSWAHNTLPQKEEKIRLATQSIDLDNFGLWLGYKKVATQALDWPRSGARDEDGRRIDEESLPSRLEEATAELSMEFAAGNSVPLTSQSDSSLIIRERKKLDVLEIETEYASPKRQSTISSYPRVSRLLSRLTIGSGSESGIIFRA